MVSVSASRSPRSAVRMAEAILEQPEAVAGTFVEGGVAGQVHDLGLFPHQRLRKLGGAARARTRATAIPAGASVWATRASAHPPRPGAAGRSGWPPQPARGARETAARREWLLPGSARWG